MTRLTKEQAAVQYLETYGGIIKAALVLYAENMGAESDKAHVTYLELTSDPAAQAANDAPSDPSGGTITLRPTTNGWLQSARAFRESADKAGKADTALTDYEETYE